MALVCRELELDAKYHPPRAMIDQVSNLKNDLIDFETAAARATGYRQKALAEAYAEQCQQQASSRPAGRWTSTT